MIPQPGSPNFHNALITHVQQSLPQGVHIDAKLFMGILLCVIAGGKHLVVEMEDVGPNERRVAEMRQRVCGMVKLITTAVFGLRTIIKSPLSPDSNTTSASFLHPSPPRRLQTHSRSTGFPRPRSAAKSLLGTSSVAPIRDPSSLDGISEPRTPSTPNPRRNRYSEPMLPPQVLILPKLHNAPDHVQKLLLDLLTRRKVDDSTKSSTTSSEDSGDGMLESTEMILPDEFFCVWVKDAYSNVPDWLLDKFALSCSTSSSAIDGTDGYTFIPTSMHEETPIIPTQFITTLHNLSNKTHMHPTLRLQISDLTSAVLHHPRLHSTLSSQSIADFKTFIRISRVVFREFTVGPNVLERLPELSGGRTYDQRGKLQDSLTGEEWYATPVDVARLWGNLMRHRVGWREGKDEVLFTLRGGAAYVTSGMAGMARMPKTDEERRDAVKKRWKEERKKRDKVLGILKEIQENVR